MRKREGLIKGLMSNFTIDGQAIGFLEKDKDYESVSWNLQSKKKKKRMNGLY